MEKEQREKVRSPLLKKIIGFSLVKKWYNHRWLLKYAGKGMNEKSSLHLKGYLSYVRMAQKTLKSNFQNHKEGNPKKFKWMEWLPGCEKFPPQKTNIASTKNQKYQRNYGILRDICRRSYGILRRSCQKPLP